MYMLHYQMLNTTINRKTNANLGPFRCTVSEWSSHMTYTQFHCQPPKPTIHTNTNLDAHSFRMIKPHDLYTVSLSTSKADHTPRHKPWCARWVWPYQQCEPVAQRSSFPAALRWSPEPSEPVPGSPQTQHRCCNMENTPWTKTERDRYGKELEIEHQW